MIVLLIAVLAIAALLAGGAAIVRSHARERRRREQLHRTRLAAVAAAESRAQEERHQAALEASDALTSVLPAIRLPWARHPLDDAPDHESYPSFSDYPGFPVAAPFQAQEEPAWFRDEKPAPYAGADYGPDEQAEYPADYPAGSAAPGYPAGSLAPDYPVGRTTPGYPAERGVPTGYLADGAAPGHWPSEPAASATHGAERSGPADRPHRRTGSGSHRGGHAKRRRS